MVKVDIANWAGRSVPATQIRHCESGQAPAWAHAKRDYRNWPSATSSTEAPLKRGCAARPESHLTFLRVLFKHTRKQGEGGQHGRSFPHPAPRCLLGDGGRALGYQQGHRGWL